jgi:predicted anti-sigma-YlaC factor YlaD
MRALSCEAVETALLEGSGPPDADVAAHLDHCRSCAELFHAVRELAPVVGAPAPVPSPALVERTFAAAAAESRALALQRRRAVFRAGVKAALVFLASLPLLAVFQAGVVAAGRFVLPEVLPVGAMLYVEVVWGLFVLAALSALAFTLTLVVGAAARPPRRTGILEVGHG